MMTPEEHTHGRYVIRTRAIGGVVKARAFAGSKAVADAEGASVADAVLAMHVHLDARDAERRAKRVELVPTADEFVDAFTRLDRRLANATGRC